MKQPCIIFNPVAKGDKARKFRRQLDALDTGCVLKPTTGPGSARPLAKQAVEEGFQLIAAAGGDGTINEVINGIGDTSEGFTQTALGILPLGTANVFARELGIPFNLSRCWSILRHDKTEAVDLVRVTYQTPQGRADRWLIQVGGAGLDARAVELVDWQLKKRAGFLAYVVAGLRALREPQPQLKLTGQHGTATGELVLFGNGRFYGGPFPFFPGANIRNGRLEARLFPRANYMTALACATRAVIGRFDRVASSQQLSSDRFQLEADRRTPLEIDGELAGELPATLETTPRVLRVAVPLGSSGTTGSSR